MSMARVARWTFVACLAMGVATSQAATEVKFKTAGGSKYELGPVREIVGYLTKPEGNGPFPAIVLLHGSRGIGYNVSEVWPDFLNKLGYVTLVVASWDSRSDIVDGHGMKGRHKGDLVGGDALGAADFLADQPFVDKTKLGVMGFSMGGGVINRYLLKRQRRSTHRNKFKAAVSFYGLCRKRDPAVRNYGVPLLMLVGDKNRLHLDRCLKGNVGEIEGVEFHVFPGVHHVFDNDELPLDGRWSGGGNFSIYSRQATNQSKELIKAFLTKHLGK